MLCVNLLGEVQSPGTGYVIGYVHLHMLEQSIDIRAVSLDLGSYGNRSTRFRDFVVGICESREY